MPSASSYTPTCSLGPPAFAARATHARRCSLTAILNGVAPIGFTNPLFHAAEAQRALERLFAECAADPRCRRAFPNLAAEFETVLARLGREPAEVEIRHPVTGRNMSVRLSRAAFAEALRVTLYSLPGNRRAPLLIHRAFEGDYAPFAQLGMQSNRALRNQLAFGMLMSVVGSEDLPRIDPAAIERETAGTFLGGDRVRQQMAVAEIWPRGEIPDDYGQPVRVDVPVLLLSGTLDPVTGPRWGARAAEHLPNSLHVVVPGAHGVGGDCVASLIRAFLRTASVEDLDTSCVEDIELPPIAVR